MRSLNGHRKHPDRASGFTLIEMLITIAVLAILSGLATPPFVSLVVRYRVSAASSDLVADLMYARSEAARRSTPVSVCQSSDGASCTTGGDWAGGRIVFLDTDSSGAVSATNPVLKVSQALESGYTMASDDITGNLIRFGADGAASAAGSITVCKSGYAGRQVSLALVGRVSSAPLSTECP